MPASHQIEVIRAEFSIEDPFARPHDASVASLVRSSDGSPLRLATSVSVYYDGAQLYVLFEGEDDAVVSNFAEHGSPLYEEDVVEVFIAPERKERYFEIEVSPTGLVFEAAIDSPHGVRSSMTTDLAWECRDRFAAVRYERTGVGAENRGVARFTTILAIPFASLGATAPGPGDSWFANFFRIDRHRSGDEFAAWSPTGKTPPDFHVAAAFGTLLFR